MPAESTMIGWRKSNSFRLAATASTSPSSFLGCVAGAVLVEKTRMQAIAAGLIDVLLTPKPQYIDSMTNWQDPLYRKIVAALPAGTKPSDYITNIDLSARKQGEAVATRFAIYTFVAASCASLWPSWWLL